MANLIDPEAAVEEMADLHRAVSCLYCLLSCPDDTPTREEWTGLFALLFHASRDRLTAARAAAGPEA